MILGITAVGDKYIDACLDKIGRFDNGRWDIHILTDQPERFPDKFTTYYYNNKVFSFYDKLLFPIKLAEKLKEPAVLLDADDLRKPTDVFINYFTDREDCFLYPSEWPNLFGKTYKDALADDVNYPYTQHRMKYAIEYWEKWRFDYNKLIPIWEWMLYIPYIKELEKIIFELERMKPLVETGTILTDFDYKSSGQVKGSTIGCAEGLMLSYALSKYNVKYKEFKRIYLSLW